MLLHNISPQPTANFHQACYSGWIPAMRTISAKRYNGKRDASRCACVVIIRGGTIKTRELRAEARIAVSQSGALNSGEPSWFPCMVLDMSDNGFLIICNESLSVGQILQFRCELYPQKTLECKIEIRHVSDSGMGTKIVEIDNKGTRLIQSYLQELYSTKLNGLG